MISLSMPLDGGVRRILDALVGGAVALVAATVVPGAPLRRPRQEAARVADELARLLRLGRQSALEQDEDLAQETLDRARETASLLGELRAAAAEGLEFVRVSPLRRHTSQWVRSMAELVQPLNRARHPSPDPAGDGQCTARGDHAG